MPRRRETRYTACVRRLALVLAAGCSTSVAPVPVALRAPVVAPAIVPPGLRLPDDVAPERYELRLAIDPAQDAFRGEVQITVALARPSDHVWLHAVDLTIAHASWEGGALTEVGRGDQMIAFGFGRRVPAGRHIVTLAYTGRMSRDQEGLFRQQAGGHDYVFSQGESVLTRRYVPCFDEPRWKVPWKVTLEVPKDLVALGNMPVVKETVTGATKQVELAETPAMPSYLLAVAVGPFELVDIGVAGARKVPVRVAALAGGRAEVGVAAKTPAVLAAIEGYTGTPLEWPKLDLVAVPRLFGAMENPGLITFDAEMLVGDDKDPEHVGHFVRVAAHELVHQWFGNSVTPAWWDDLWLSEAFASWLGDKIAQQLGALDDAPLELALAREQALEADADSDARALHRRVDGNADPDNEFDAISYEKGEAVLATFEAFAGADRMRDALRDYLASHKDSVATRADVVTAMANAGGPELATAFAGYLEHVGAPVVDVTVHCDHIELHSRDRLIVPVCVRTDHVARVCLLVGESASIPVHACPTWVWANAGAGYYTVATHAPAPIAKLSPAERIAAGDDAAAAFARGELAPVDALAELRRLADTRDVYARLGALAIARAVDPIVTDAQRPAWEAWLAARFADRLSRAALVEAKGEVREPDQPAELELRDALLRLAPASGDARTRARELLAALIAKGEPPPELVAIAAPDRATLDKLAKIAEVDPARRDAMIDAIAAGPSAGAGVAVDLVALRNLPAWSAIAAYFDRGSTRSAAWAALRPRLPELLGRLAPAERAAVIDATATLCGGAADVEAAFTPQLANIEDGRRRLTHAIAQIQRCAALRAKVGNLPL